MEETAVKTWSILDILKVSEKLLKEKNIDKPRLNAELLLCGTLKTERIKLYLDFEKPLTEQEISDYRAKIKRRLAHEPLQYILGSCEFYELKFNVNPSVLIPRQETELLVEKTLEIIHSNDDTIPEILEIGTGSGCISIAVAANSECRIDAIDITDNALETAKSNSDINCTTDKINFRLKSIFDLENFDGYNIVISNPPYIPLNIIDSLDIEVKDFEPVIALTDNEDGLKFYRNIIELAKKTSHSIKVLLEIGDNSKSRIEGLLNETSVNNGIFYKDLIGINRVLYFEINGS
jgi:release factor glutamine methyltransferase